MRFIDFFAGIGGFRFGLKQNEFDCVGWCENDKFAQDSYRAIHNPEQEAFFDDIRDVRPDELPEAELYTGGFPCQDFSIAGERKGSEGERASLLYYFLTLVKKRQPRYILLENVPGFISSNEGRDFFDALNTIQSVGYEFEWQILNSRDFGVPQHRKRVYIIGHFGGITGRQVFPFRSTSELSCSQIGELTEIEGHDYLKRVYDEDGISPAVGTFQGGNQEHFIAVTNDHGEIRARKPQSTCLDANYHKGLDKHNQRTAIASIENKNIRRLTPLECWRLQGFPDHAFEQASKTNSDTQLYKQAGNSVTVNVIESIGKRLKGVYNGE